MALTERQQQANELMAKHQHVLLYGGSRSGKTWVILRAIAVRAMKARNSTHAILRLHFGHLKDSIIFDTFPTMMATEFPQMEGKWTLNKSQWDITFPNGSRILFGGLDDHERTEKILGQEHCVDPNTYVLTATLDWVRAADLEVGDEVMGFNEDLKQVRKLGKTRVEGARRVTKPRVKVRTDEGTIVVSVDHYFVAELPATSCWKWVRAAYISPGTAIQYYGAPSGEAAIVQKVETLDDGKVVALRTEARTFIAEGFLSHNSTIFMNEASQISYASRNKAMTRLAQNKGLTPKEFVDCNPPSKGWWGYKLFIEGKFPESQSRPDTSKYAYLGMNPHDNEHLPEGYIDEFLKSLPTREQKRFLQGEFSEDVDEPLWTQAGLDSIRISDDDCPQLDRIVISVDPSGQRGGEERRSDEVGIMVMGVRDDRAYLIEDASGGYTPAKWARKVLKLYDLHNADAIVAEQNYGGELVRSNIQSHDASARVRLVWASRGKHVRADPVAGLIDQDKIRHVGEFGKLEDQLLQFSTHGYTGDRSPDRADAYIWAATDLVVSNRKKPARVIY